MQKRGKGKLSSKDKKRGLSTIVITLIIILISLVAVGIVWVVVRNLIEETTPGIGIERFTLDAKIKDVNIDNSSNNVSLTLKRNAGAGEFSKMKFLFYDGKDSEVITEAVSLSELEERRFNFHLSILNVNNLISISIVPLIKQDNKEILGNVLDKYTISSGQISIIIPGCSPFAGCGALGYVCGNWTNGTCSGLLTNCGDCGALVCSSSGQCVATCAPLSSNYCSTMGYVCGNWGNNTCSGNLSCGNCPGGSTCNATGRCVDTTPPTRTNAAPTGTLAAGTTQTNMSLITNENATCRYSNISGTAYSSMTNTFTGTLLSHSRIITGLTDGGNYNYYVRCNDTAGNFNTNDYAISFSVSTSVDTTPPVLSSGLPTGTLAAGTTQTNMSLITNENATCRYSNISGTAYSSMTNTFTGTLLSHSRIITGLTDGGNYNYYVRCNDTAGNFNTNDYAISFSVSSSAEGIILANRRIIWNPGIPGGIPNYTTICANVKNAPYNAVGDGVADDTTAIRNAISACPIGQVVYLPAGTYKTTGTITVNKGIVVRGNGPSQTKILYTGSSDAVIFSNNGYKGSYVSITSGYTKDSTTLTLSSVSGLVVNDIIYVTQNDDGTLVNPGGCSWCGPDEGNHCMGQIVRIISINGNTITIDRPMYYTFSSSLNPVISKYTSVLKNAGIEDIEIERTTSNEGTSVWFDFAYNCWARNIEIHKSGRYHFLLSFSAACTIRDSYFHDAVSSYGSDHAYAIFSRFSTSDNLIENNIVNHTRHAAAFEGGGAGTVIGYNYFLNPYDGDYSTTSQDMSYHGAHPYMVLWEGNIGYQVAPDNTWGSSSHSTYFRNHVTNKADIATDWLEWVMDIEAKSTYHNFIGNILGYSGMTGYVYDAGNNCGLNKVIWRWGCIDQDGSNTGRSNTPKNTALVHGNFDYVTNSVIWNSSISDHNLPNSYYLSSKPAFFGSLPWPSIGPDLSPMVGTIPAKIRYGA